MLRPALRLGIVLCAPLALACGGVATVGALIAQPIVAILPDKMPDVEDAMRTYNDDMRWGRVRQAVAQVDREQQEAFLALFEDDVTPYQFTSTEIVTSQPTKFAEDGETPIEFDVLAAYEYYRPPVVVERKIRQRQVWRYVEAERRWVVAPDLGAFRDTPPAARAR